MTQLFRNNAYGALGASLSDIATTLTVATGQGDRFPGVTAPDFFMLTLQDASNNIEIVKVTARGAGSDTMTIVRAQEGTAARSWNIGDVAELRLTAFALNPLALLEGSATAAAIRAILDVPTRAGGDASGNWSINAATATVLQTARNITIGASTKSFNGSANISYALSEIGAVGNTGNETVGGAKSFSGSIAVGGSAAPAVSLDVQSAGANVLTSALTTGVDDLNFRIGAMNGLAGSTGTSQGKLGLFYLGVGEAATIDFRRGATTSDGFIAFRTSGNDRATIDNSGNFSATGNITANGRFVGDGSVPAGAVMHFAMSTPPTGWLKANGALVSRTTYAALFAAIGTTYGAGDGSTTFALPDLRGEFIRSLDDGRGVDSGRGIGTAQGQALQSHSHNIQASVAAAGFGAGDIALAANNGTAVNGRIINEGGTETRPRNVALLACIKF